MKNENAARPGRQGGNDFECVQPEYCPSPLDKTTRDRNLFEVEAAFSRGWGRRWEPWLDRVELCASPGVAGNSERAVAAAIAALVPPEAALFVSVPGLAVVAGLGQAATRAALRRLVGRRLVRFEPGNGRGIRSVIEIRGPA